MTIEFLRGWRRFKPGDLWSPDDGVATTLIRRHIAIERVPVVAEVVKRKRGRPRKVLTDVG